LGEASRYLLRFCVEGAFLDLVTSAGRSTQNRGSVGVLPITALRWVRDIFQSQSQSQSSVHPRTGPDLPTAVQRSSTARLTRACIVRRHRTALSALPGRQPRGGRDATIAAHVAATAAAARAGGLPAASATPVNARSHIRTHSTAIQAIRINIVERAAKRQPGSARL
jgi:hypothetical protein